MTFAYCRNCERETQHTQDVPPINHAMHILLSLLCCGCWVWIYLFIALTRKPSDWYCSHCGHGHGRLTEDDLDDLEDEYEDRQRHKRRRRQEQSDRIKDLAGSAASAGMSGVESVVHGVANFGNLVTKTIDEAFKKLSGGDVVLYRVYVGILVGVILLFLTYVGAKVWPLIFG